MNNDRIEEPKRPYRIWHEEKKRDLPGRYYVYPRNAHNAAMAEVRWARVGQTLAVWDVRTGRVLGQYTRKLHTISWRR